MSILINDNISNNLIVQSILSPALNLGDDTPVGPTTQKEINKSILLNRVKKMTQAERHELVDTLKKLSRRIKLSGNTPPLPPLREKGISILLFADDGEKAEKHGFLVAFFRGFCNRFGDRVSSAVVMTKICNIQQALSAQMNQLPENVDLEFGIHKALNNLQQRIDEPHPAQKIQPLIEKIAGLKSEFATASESDWSGLTTFLNFFVSLDTFNAEIEKIDSSQTYKEMSEKINGIKELVSSRTGSRDIQGLAQHLLDHLDLKLIPTRRQEDLRELANWKFLGKKNTFGYWKGKLIVPLIKRILISIELELKNVIHSFDVEKAKMEKEKELIQKRLEAYQDSVLKVAKMKESRKAHSVVGKESKQLGHLESICELLKFLVGSKEKSFDEFKMFLNVACDRFLLSPDTELKATGNLDRIFFRLKQYVNNDQAVDLNELVAGLHHLDALEDKALCDRLKAFTSNPAIYRTDVEKKSFINDYITYLDFIFDGWKNEALRKKNQLNEVLKPQPPVVLQPTIDEPLPSIIPSITILNTPTSVTRVIPVVPNDGLPSVLEIPKEGNTHLQGIAIGIQYNRSDASADLTFYQQLTPGETLPWSSVDNVCGNFYWIMKDAGKLCGPLNADGHSEDSNWGGKVFTTGNVDGVSPSVARPLLNHYRVQAIVEVLQGRIRTRANQNV